MPALVRWRMLGAAGPVTQWQTAVDFRETIPPASDYPNVYARWTRQNRATRAGRYRVFLAHGWDCERLASGWYRIQVEASDTRNNTTVVAIPVRVVR